MFAEANLCLLGQESLLRDFGTTWREERISMILLRDIPPSRGNKQQISSNSQANAWSLVDHQAQNARFAVAQNRQKPRVSPHKMSLVVH